MLQMQIPHLRQVRAAQPLLNMKLASTLQVKTSPQEAESKARDPFRSGQVEELTTMVVMQTRVVLETSFRELRGMRPKAGR